MLWDRGYSFCSSSAFIAEKVVYPAIRHHYGYKSYDECFARRHEKGLRKVWYDLIADYCKNDPTKLAREIFAEYSIYCGCRNIKEIRAVIEAKDMSTFVIWVSAEKRITEEPKDSFTITKDVADYIVENNGTLKDLEKEVDRLMDFIPI